MKADLRSLARSLLDREVMTLDIDDRAYFSPSRFQPDFQDSHTSFEKPCRLEDFLYVDGDPGELADLGRTGDPHDGQVQAQNTRRREDFQALVLALKQLARTGRIDQDVFRRGEGTLGEIIAGLAVKRERFRNLLDPNNPDVLKSADHISKEHGVPQDVALKDVLRNGYVLFNLAYSQAIEALESMKDGLQEINEAIDKPPPSVSRA